MSNKYRIHKLNEADGTWEVLFHAIPEDKELKEAFAKPQPNRATDPTGAATSATNYRSAFVRLKMSVALPHLPKVPACT